MTFILGNNPFGGGAKENGGRERRNAVAANSSLLWPGAIIPYEIASVFDGMHTLQQFSTHEMMIEVLFLDNLTW